MASIRIMAGELRHRATIEGKPAVMTPGATDTRGHPERLWTPRFTRWAKIEPLTGRKLEIARQLVPTATHQVTMRFDADVTVRDRVIFEGRTFYIGDVTDIEERKVRMELTCTEKTPP